MADETKVNPSNDLQGEEPKAAPLQMKQTDENFHKKLGGMSRMAPVQKKK